MTPQDQHAIESMHKSKLIAEKMGEVMGAETDSARVAVMASAILYAGSCCMAGVSVHQAVELFMTLYKDFDGATGETH